MPKIPEEKFRPSLPETIIDLIKSIALEEVALSNLINAEAEKIQAFVGKDFDFPTTPSSKEIIDFNQTINRIMDTVLMKEFLLLKKLETVIRIEVKEKEFEEE
jgi:hypothetical protein